jgi:hypothetical protein
MLFLSPVTLSTNSPTDAQFRCFCETITKASNLLCIHVIRASLLCVIKYVLAELSRADLACLVMSWRVGTFSLCFDLLNQNNRVSVEQKIMPFI